MNIKKGSAFFSVIIYILSVFFIASAVFFKVSSIKSQVESEKEHVLSVKNLEKEIYEFIKQSSYFDFYERTFKKDSITFVIESLNKKINPNFLNDEYLEIFTDPRDFETFNKENADGILYDFSELKTETDYSDFFSSFPSLNINLCNKKVLENYMKIMKTEPFFILEKIGNMRKKKQLILNDAILKEVLGVNYDILFPFLNCAPPVDVRYADEKILKKILRPDKIGTKNALLYDELLLLRNRSGNIDSEFLRLISRIDTKAANLLGCRTYFWKITAFNEKHSFSETVYVSPSSDGHKYLIEKRTEK